MDSAKVEGLSLAILNNNIPVYIKAYGYKFKTKNDLLDTATVIMPLHSAKQFLPFWFQKYTNRE